MKFGILFFFASVSVSAAAVISDESLAKNAVASHCSEGDNIDSNGVVQAVCTRGNGNDDKPHPTKPHPIHKKALPTSFQWLSSDVLISPKNDSREVVSIKDPSIVHYKGVWHVFTSIVSSLTGYSMAYLNFTDFADAHLSPQFYLVDSAIGPGYRAAPQIFYFEPQKLWYLIFQDGNSGYSTNPDIGNPQGWSAVTNFFAEVPATVMDNWGVNGGWLDMWVICDEQNCYLFSSDDNGNLYRSQTALADFPNGMGETVIAMQDSNKFALYEASNVYNYGSGYLLLVEAIGDDGHRYFRSWNATDLVGPWSPLADTEANPFARANNVVFRETPGWTQDISHGEMIRDSFDQTLTIDPCNLRYLYQGDTPGNYSDYNSIPWRLALLTQTNSAC